MSGLHTLRGRNRFPSFSLTQVRINAISLRTLESLSHLSSFCGIDNLANFGKFFSNAERRLDDRSSEKTSDCLSVVSDRSNSKIRQILFSGLLINQLHANC